MCKLLKRGAGGGLGGGRRERYGAGLLRTFELGEVLTVVSGPSLTTTTAATTAPRMIRARLLSVSQYLLARASDA